MLFKRKIIIILVLISVVRLNAVDVLRTVHGVDVTSDLLGHPFAPVKPSNISELCKVESQLYLEELAKLTPWALNMYDASTKLPSAIITGNIQQLGNYDQCLRISANRDAIQGQQCLVQIQFLVTMDTGPTRMRQNTTTSRLDEGTSLDMKDLLIAVAEAAGIDNWTGPASAPYMWSYCLPASCTHNDVATALRHKLEYLNTPGRVEVVVSVAENQCYKRDVRALYTKLTQADVAIISLLCVIVLLIILSTAYEVVLANKNSTKLENKPRRYYSVLSSFSLLTNGRRLLSTNKAKDTLSCIDGIRFLTLCWVIYGHNYYMSAMSPLLNSSDVQFFRNDWSKMVVMNGTLSTDTFFLISGIVVCYTFMMQRSTKNQFSVGRFYLHRYLRLSPPYAMLIFFYATLFYYVGSGPLWNTWVGTNRDNCVMNWWTNLLYINNYVGLNHSCMNHTWYLAVDMQLFWISPLVMYPLWRWPRLGKIILALLLATTILVPCIITVTQHLAALMMYTTDGAMVGNVYIQIYTRTYNRGGPYFVGIGMGYFIFLTKGNPVKLSNMQVLSGWLFSTFICLTVLFGVYGFYQPSHHYDAVEAGLYAGLHRPVWALGVAWVVTACVQGYGGPVNRLLSWKTFLPLSRLSYSAYLCHFMVLLYNTGSARTPTYINNYNVTLQFLSSLIIILLLAAIISLAFEVPFLNLERSLLSRGRANKVKEEVVSNKSTTEQNGNQCVNGTADNIPIPMEIAIMNQLYPGPNRESDCNDLQYGPYDNVGFRK